MYSYNLVNFQASTTILNAPTKKSLETCMQLVYLIYQIIYLKHVYKENLALNNQQCLINYKTQQTNQQSTLRKKIRVGDT